MEGHGSQPGDIDQRACRSGTALRELEQRARSALDASRDQVSRLETEIIAQLEAVAAALAEERAQQISQDDWKHQLAEFEQKLADQQTAWNEQRSAWGNERSTLERECAELRQKFELALQDVQRLRARAAEMEQELARRPETASADSAELVALRAERDALNERLEELEQRPATPSDPEAEQQLADLQRRFEMAVEDVRELKTKNAELEAKLAASHRAPAPASDGGGMDWESQKRRLLASLDGDEGASLSTEERTTIQSTIEITDAIVAEKDGQISELQAQLSGGSARSTADEERERRIHELIDADEVIAEHRKKIAQLEREMEDKLRTAELELSVERAKLARQKAELEQLRAELDARQAEGPGVAAGPGVPRRRWLSKLGLNGEES